MVLFIILTAIALILAAIATFCLVTGGVAFFIIFGDLVVCIAIIVFITKWLFKRKKK